MSDAGSVTSSVTGDTGATSCWARPSPAAAKRSSKWLLERQSQSFDAVFVPAGTRIAIHVDQELPIDLDTYRQETEP